MSHWGGEPYGEPYTPKVEAKDLEKRNRKYYNIGQPHAGLPGTQVPLACHHVVGWDIIWGFWNAMIGRKNYNAARTYLSFFGAAKPTTVKMGADIEAGKFAGQSEWEVRMCWKPSNIVRGPEKRTDDPNAEKDMLKKIDFQNASTDLYGKRVAGLIGAGRAMCYYIKDGDPLHAEKAIEYFRSIQYSKIMEWDEKVWEVDPKSPTYSNAPSDKGGYTVVQPKWRALKA